MVYYSVMCANIHRTHLTYANKDKSPCHAFDCVYISKSTLHLTKLILRVYIYRNNSNRIPISIFYVNHQHRHHSWCPFCVNNFWKFQFVVIPNLCRLNSSRNMGWAAYNMGWAQVGISVICIHCSLLWQLPEQ